MQQHRKCKRTHQHLGHAEVLVLADLLRGHEAQRGAFAQGLVVVGVVLGLHVAVHDRPARLLENDGHGRALAGRGLFRWHVCG